MRHRKNVKHFDRSREQAKALMRSLATSLVLHEKITTTTAKAKELRRHIEPLITKGKKNDLHARRQLLSYLYEEAAVNKVLNDLSVRYKDKNGGYTRVVKLKNRKGDGAQVARIEFV